MIKEFVLLIFCFGFFCHLFPKDMEIGNQKKQDRIMFYTKAYSMVDSYTTASFSETLCDIGAKDNHAKSHNLTLTFCSGNGHAIHLDFAIFSFERVCDLASFQLKNRLKYFLIMKRKTPKSFLLCNTPRNYDEK